MTQATSSISQTSPALVEASQGMTLSDLPTDMILEVLARSNVASIGALGKTCKRFVEVLQEERIWKVLFSRDFPSCALPPKRESYVNRHRFHTNFTRGAYTTRTIDGMGRGPFYSLAITDKEIVATSSGMRIHVATGQSSDFFDVDRVGLFGVLVAGNRVFTSYSFVTTIDLYHLKSGQFEQTFTGHRGAVSCMGFYGGNLISGSHDKTARIWDMSTGISHCLEGHTDAVTCLVVTPEGLLLTGSYDKTIRVWDLKSREFLKILGEHDDCVTSLALDGDHLISCSQDHMIKTWSLKDSKCVRPPLKDTHELSRIASLEGKAVASSNEGLRLFDLNFGTRLDLPRLGIFDALVFTGDKLYVAGGFVKIFDFQAKDEEIFAEIAAQLRSPSDLFRQAELRFLRMPKKAKREIFLHLHRIIAPGDSLGNPSDAFLELRWDSAIPEQKAQAIEDYLAEKQEVKK